MEGVLARGKYRIDDASRIRDELRQSNKEKQLEIDQLEDDVDRWREAYYALRDNYSVLKTELTILKSRLDLHDGVTTESSTDENKPQ